MPAPHVLPTLQVLEYQGVQSPILCFSAKTPRLCIASGASPHLCFALSHKFRLLRAVLDVPKPKYGGLRPKPLRTRLQSPVFVFSKTCFARSLPTLREK